MPRDPIISAESYEERLARHQDALAAAKREHEAAAVAVEMRGGSEDALRIAGANVRDIEARIEALHSWRARSQAEEAAADERRAAAERLKEAHELLALGETVKADSNEVDKRLAALLRACAKLTESRNAFDLGMHRIIRGLPRERLVTDVLGHNHLGPLILGKLREANLPGFDTVDDPEVAMRAFQGVNVAGDQLGHTRRAIQLASANVPELKEGPEHDPRDEAEAA